MHPLPFSILSFLLASPANASTVLGNPTSGVELVAGSDTTVEQIVASYCVTGSQVVVLQTTLGKGQSTPFTLTEDTFCGLELDVRWTPAASLTTLTVADVDELKIQSASGAWVVELDADAETATFVAL